MIYTAAEALHEAALAVDSRAIDSINRQSSGAIRCGDGRPWWSDGGASLKHGQVPIAEIVLAA